MQIKTTILAVVGASTIAAAYNPYQDYSIYARDLDYEDAFDPIYTREADPEADAEALADAFQTISDVVRRSADAEPILPFLAPL